MTPAPKSHIIAVTGANGLIASGFIRLALEQGYKVLGLDLMPVSFTGMYPPSPPESMSGKDDQTEVDCSNLPTDPLPPPPSGSEITPLDQQLLHQAISAHPGSYTSLSVDLLDYDSFLGAVREAGCDALVHLAAVYRGHDGFGNYREGGIREHEVYNINMAMSYNALNIAVELGITRVVLASSVNSIGMLFSKQPQFDYLPLDEKHPHYPEDAYSLAKYTSGLQASSIVRRYPSLPLRIASLRFHWVVPSPLCHPTSIASHPGSPKDLFGWVSVRAAADAVMRAIIVPTTMFPLGAESFFVVARTMCGGRTREEVLEEYWKDVEWRGDGTEGNGGMFNTSKAERMLGWKEEGYPMV